MYREGVKKANVCIMRRLVVALLFWCCLTAIAAIVAGAQERIGVSRQGRSYPGNRGPDSVETDPEYLSRAIPGFFVGAAGTLVGGLLGLAVAGKCNGTGRGLCTQGDRFGKGLIGAALGGLVGIGLGAVSTPLGLTAAITIPVGAATEMRKC
jgi:hypothetical protein